MTPTRFIVNRSFALIWLAQGLSNIGDFAFITTLVLWIGADLTRGRPIAPAAVGGLLVANAIPNVLVAPWAGVFADRWPKRRTMLLMDAVRAGLIAALLLATLSLSHLLSGDVAVMAQISAIYATVLIESSCAQLFTPASVSLIGAVVSPADRARASARQMFTRSLAFMIGPSVAGVLFPYGAGWALAINACSFIASFLVLGLLRPMTPVASSSESESGTVRRAFLAGVRYLAHSIVLRVLLLATVLDLLGVGALNALNVFFTAANLHQPYSYYGFLNASLSAGALLAAVLVGRFAMRLGLLRVFWTSMMVLGGALLLYSRLDSYVAALAVFAVVGMGNVSVNIALQPLLLRSTPPEFVGRISTLFGASINIASMASMMVASALASTVLVDFRVVAGAVRLGRYDIILSVSGALVLCAGLLVWRLLRGMASHETAGSLVGTGDAVSA